MRSLVFVLMLLGMISPLAGQSSGPALVIPKWAGEACVEPTPIMRREHKRFLFEQRDATVHQGVRGGRYSLNGCIRCHVNRDDTDRMIPVNAAGQFCESCHTFAGVDMDCFQCHATTPD